LRQKKPLSSGMRRQGLQRSKGPNGRARKQDKNTEDDEGDPRQRRADRAEDRPCQLYQNAELEDGIDDGLGEVGAEVSGRTVVTDGENAEVAEDVPDTIRTKNRECSIDTPVEEQSDNRSFDPDIGKPEYVVQVHKSRPA
jgi:hypothetical protein